MLKYLFLISLWLWPLQAEFGKDGEGGGIEERKIFSEQPAEEYTYYHELYAAQAAKPRRLKESVSIELEREDRYRLHPGDRFIVAIYGEANTERELTIDSAGCITYPIIGTLKAADKTIDTLRKEMNERLQKVYLHTFVLITPIEFGSEYYTILGSVKIPGRKYLAARETILSALARSGGFPTGQFHNRTIDMADLDHALLLRRGEYIPVDFRKLVLEGDRQTDVFLQRGDYIYIPSSLEKEIFVLGEVAMPSALGYINRVTLAEAVAQAGGTTFNASSRAVVIRGSLHDPYAFYIDINLIFKGVEPDFPLKPGDIVYVPPRKFTLLREIIQYGIRIFASTAASTAGSSSWASISGAPVYDNVNVVPSAIQSTVAPPVIFQP